MVGEAKLQEPDRVTSVTLRKFRATITQVFDMSPTELQWVCDHLGHSLNVHKIHYRSTSDVIERLNISKILLCQDNKLLSNFQGKSLKDIPIECLVSELKPHGKTAESPEHTEEDPAESLIATTCEDNDPQELDDYFIPNMPHVDDALDLPAEEHTEKKKKKKKMINRHRWTVEEINEVKRLFRKYLEKSITPGVQAIKEAIASSKENDGAIWRLNPDNITKKVSWLKLNAGSEL